MFSILIHVVNLSETLNINLNQIGIEQKIETIWEWLRSINFHGVSYGHNYDNI